MTYRSTCGSYLSRSSTAVTASTWPCRRRANERRKKQQANGLRSRRHTLIRPTQISGGECAPGWLRPLQERPSRRQCPLSWRPNKRDGQRRSPVARHATRALPVGKSDTDSTRLLGACPEVKPRASAARTRQHPSARIKRARQPARLSPPTPHVPPGPSAPAWPPPTFRLPIGPTIRGGGAPRAYWPREQQRPEIPTGSNRGPPVAALTPRVRPACAGRTKDDALLVPARHETGTAPLGVLGGDSDTRQPPFCRGRVVEGGLETLGVVAARRGEGPSSGLVAGDAGAVCLGAGMALWDAGCACGDTHRAGRGIPAPTRTPPGLPASAREPATRPAPLGGPSEKPDAGRTTDCVIPTRRSTRRVQRHALRRVARLICKVIRAEQEIVNGLYAVDGAGALI